ncbi:bifunctional DNA primase/polymerase [Herbaspirillum sp.]|uniref:bifunctional DNA primase/polymerase n=1 Tax=Herbaspirillum sp. TaxID=1890675 RepID=UPI000C0B3A72|nr:bifunctional DNA primase/polymerase [Herbaspirillum sp.]MAF05118.1 hypothetical protein [Herbaspirillum sp.]
MSKEKKNKLLEAALEYVEMGYRVFPLIPGTKKPLVARGLLEATSDKNQICYWWAQHPRANIGLSTDGQLVIDVDTAANPWLYSHPDRMRSLASGPIQQTPHGGLHYFYTQPKGQAWGNTTSRVAPHVDTRGHGGYVVVPPSSLEERADGKTWVGRYAWIPEHELEQPGALGEPPGWLVKQLDELQSGGRFVLQTQFDAEKIPEGRRNSTLTSLSGAMRRIGLDATAIGAALAEINIMRCQPPLDAEEVAKITQSVARYEPNQAATDLAEGGVYLAQEDNEPEHPGLFPDDLLHVPGLVGQLVEHNLSTAIRPQPILALGAALALLATITGRKVTDVYGSQTNLYVVSLCPSGGGKEHARQLNKEALKLASWEELVGPESFGSSAGIVSAVEIQPAILFQLDEIGRYFQTFHDTSKPHLHGIFTVLLRLFSSSGGLYVGDAYADAKRVKRIHWPHACAYGTTVPEAFYTGLNRDTLTNGFVARLLVFETDTPKPPRQANEKRSVPKEIVDAVSAWKEFSPSKGNLDSVNPRPRVVHYSPEAETIFRDFDGFCEQAEENAKDVGAIWTRAVEKARKCALLHAASEMGPNVQEVGQRAALWACSLCEYLTQRLLYGAVAHVGESRLEVETKRVLRAVRKTGKAGMRRSEITWKFNSMKKNTREEILETLVESGKILTTQARGGGRGRPRTVYFAREHANLTTE